MRAHEEARLPTGCKVNPSPKGWNRKRFLSRSGECPVVGEVGRPDPSGVTNGGTVPEVTVKAIGKKVGLDRYPGMIGRDGREPGMVVGILKNFDGIS